MSAVHPPCPGYREEEKAPTAMMTIPYIMGVSEEIMSTCRSYKIRIAFTSERTIRLRLTRVKDPLPVEQQSIVVYQIPCSCGKVYIEKTIRRLETI